MTAIYISSSEAVIICDKARKIIAFLKESGAEHTKHGDYDVQSIIEAVKVMENQYNDARKLGVLEDNVVICISSDHQTLLVEVLGER